MHAKCSALFVTAALLIATSAAVSDKINELAACTEDYTPCTCEQSSSENGWSVFCDQVTIQAVKSLFGRKTPRDLSSFKLSIASSERDSIPADLLGDTRTSGIYLDCSAAPTYELIVDENAFRSSENLTRLATINGCTFLSQPNFAFLSEFRDLANLNINNSRNFSSFEGLPSQSNLYYISILYSRGFEALDNVTVALPGLRMLYLHDNDLNDFEVSKILWSLALSSRESLEELRLYNNRLTTIPSIISSFSKMNQLMMEHNTVQSIRTRSLAFYGYVSYLQLGDNNISYIEPSAFGEGPFGLVYLHQNLLTRFESYVFQVMLERMVLDGFGRVSLYENPFICDCHLAWLIRYKRDLLSVLDGGQCSNSTLFTDLDPNGFINCPVFACPAGFNGNFPNPLSCSSYYECTNGREILVQCPGGLVFNPAYQLCDWPYNVPTCNVGN